MIDRMAKGGIYLKKGSRVVTLKFVRELFAYEFIMLQQVSGVKTPETKNRPLCG